MGSPFASAYRREIPMPGDPEHRVTLQKLGNGAIERAEAAHLRKFIAGISPRGWAKRFQQKLDAGTATDKEVRTAAVDPLAGLDRVTVAYEGIKGWTYTVALESKTMPPVSTVQPKPVTLEAIEDLDDDVIETLALDLMKLTKPWLFQTAEEQQVAQKND